MTKENRFEVFIPTSNVEQVMPMVRYLREKGLVQGYDFDFAYNQTRLNWQSTDPYEYLIRAGVTFYMREEKWVTFLRMRYSDQL
jgi:hypothetical protein